MDNIEKLVESLTADAAPVRPASHPFILSLKWMGAAVTYLVAILAFSGLQPDLLQKLRDPLFAAEIAVLVGIFITTSLSTALLAFPDMHQKKSIALVAPILMFVLFLLVILLAWYADTPPSPLPLHSYECTSCIILVALLPAGWTLYAMRHLASTHYHLAGGIALLSAFSVGALWLRLHEINDSIIHVIEWHYLPMLAFGIVGLWLGRLLLRW